MKKIMLALALITGVTMMAADKTTTVFTVSPKMHCESCENKIKKNLRFEKGVKEITTSVPKQTVTITYDPEKTSVEKLQAGFKKIGYTATEAEKTATKSTTKK
jgi:copper chaperone CopZ